MLEELLDKIADGKLNALERQQLREEARGLQEAKQLSRSWVVGGTNIPIFQSPMEVIYSKVLEADTASITVQIPSGYKHLFIMGSGRCSIAGPEDSVALTINGDTGNNYGRTGVGLSGGVASSYRVDNDPYCLIGVFPGTTATSGANGTIFAYILHYYSTQFWKSILANRGAYTNTLSVLQDYSTWKNTNPVKYIGIYMPSSNLLSGSVVSVYGIL